MKKTRIFLVIALAAMVCSLLAACGVETYKVEFDTAGGNSVVSQTVMSGKSAVEPKEPQKSGYVFAGWYDGDTQYSFASKVTGNVSLTARWKAAVPDYAEVTFKGAGVDFTQTVGIGNKAIEPKTPEKTDYRFDGWYNGETLYDFSRPVTADLTLTARFTQLTPVTVGFDSDGGSDVQSVRIYAGQAVGRPADPVRRLYHFNGWTLDGEPYDFTAPVAENMELKAAWLSVFQFDTKTNTIVDAVGAEGIIEFPEEIGGVKVLNIGGALFAGNSGVTEVFIGGFIETIGKNAFEGCENLTRVTFAAGENDLQIPIGCFKNCVALNQVALGRNISSVGAEAFGGCALLTSFDFAAVTNPKGVGSGSFSGSGLKAVVSAALEEFGEKAFYECRDLSSVTLNEGFKKLGSYSLSRTGIASITLPSTLTAIGDGCFAETSISTLRIPKLCTTIYVNVFAGCAEMTTVEVDPDNTSMSAFDGVLFDKRQTKIIYAPGKGRTALKVPDTVTSYNTGSLNALGEVASVSVVKGDYETPATVKVRADDGVSLAVLGYSKTLIFIAPTYKGTLTVAADITEIDAAAIAAGKGVTFAVADGNVYFLKHGAGLYKVNIGTISSPSTAEKPLAFKLYAIDFGQEGKVLEMLPPVVKVGETTIYTTLNLSLSKIAFKDYKLAGIRFADLNLYNAPNENMFADLPDGFKVYVPAGTREDFIEKVGDKAAAQLNGKIIEDAAE